MWHQLTFWSLYRNCKPLNSQSGRISQSKSHSVCRVSEKCWVSVSISFSTESTHMQQLLLLLTVPLLAKRNPCCQKSEQPLGISGPTLRCQGGTSTGRSLCCQSYSCNQREDIFTASTTKQYTHLLYTHTLY